MLSLQRDATVHMTPEDTVDAGGTRWRRVTVGAMTGWLPADTVEPAAKRRVIRLGAPAGHTGQGAEGIKTHAIPSASVERPVLAEPPSAPPTASNASYKVTLPRLALRVAPDINAAILTSIPQDSRVDATTQAPVGPWRAVSFNGQAGWVASQWLEPTQR
jgi:pilus assembly protein CpaC